MATTTRKPRPRRRRSSVSSVTLLWGALASTGGVTLLAFAGVDLSVRAVSHALLALAALTALLLPSRSLGRAGAVVWWAGAGAAAGLAVLAGCVPVPASWRGGPAGWGPASVEVDLTVTELCAVGWPIGVGLLVTVLAAAVGRRSVFERWVVGVAAAVGVVALLHWFGPWRGLFGLVPLPLGVHQTRFAAPFLNANHFGGFVLVGLPTVAARVGDATRHDADRVVSGALLLLLGGLLVVVDSTAPLAIAGLQLVALVGARLGRPRATAALVAVVLAGAVAWDWSDASRAGLLHGRSELWAATARMIGRHWVLGVGGGTYVRAIGPFRTDDRFEQWDHAHNDWLEAVSELGLVGIGLLLVAVVLLRPRRSPDPARALPLDLGVAGVALHATVDFPMQVPAIVGAVAAVWAVRLALHGPSRTADPRVVRALVALTAVVQLAAAGWTWRTSVVESDRRAVGEERVTHDVVDRLRRLAPESPERLLAESMTAAEEGHPGRAAASAIVAARRAPLDPDLQRVAALQLQRSGAREEALAAAQRAHTLGRWDWRNHVVLGLVAKAQGETELEMAAWRAGFGVGMPSRFYEHAWTLVPVGLVWVDAVAGHGPRAHANLAAFLLRKGDTESAALAFEQAALTDGDERFPQYVDVLVALGRLEEAEAYADAALTAEPGDRDFSVARARVLQAADRWSEAADAWEQVARTHRNVKDAPVQAVRAAEKTGPDAAYAMIRRLEVSRIGGPALTLEEAKVHFRAGDFSGCASAVARSRYLDDPKAAPALRKQADLCRKAALAPTAETPAP